MYRPPVWKNKGQSGQMYLRGGKGGSAKAPSGRERSVELRDELFKQIKSKSRALGTFQGQRNLVFGQ